MTIISVSFSILGLREREVCCIRWPTTVCGSNHFMFSSSQSMVAILKSSTSLSASNYHPTAKESPPSSNLLATDYFFHAIIQMFVSTLALFHLHFCSSHSPAYPHLILFHFFSYIIVPVLSSFSVTPPCLFHILLTSNPNEGKPNFLI